MSELPPDLRRPRRSTRWGTVGIASLGALLLAADIALLLHGIGLLQ